MNTLLETSHIHKRFPGVQALRGVSFDLRPSEVHALVGENGAGKSTLMHILAGVHQPDEGAVKIAGTPVVIGDEQHAQALGIGIVYQERSLFELLTVAENIFAGRQPRGRWGLIDRSKMRAETHSILQQLDLHIAPDTPLGALNPAQQQMVEVAKALALNARILIFDEPTAALTEAETNTLFRVIRQLRAQGKGIIYISHRLHEIFALADRVTVLRDGTGRGTFAVAETSPDELVTRMVGRELDAEYHQSHVSKFSERVVLQVQSLATHRVPEEPRTLLRDVSLQVHAGEIVGLAGLAGAGRTELGLAIFGANPIASGAVLLDGMPVNIGSPRAAIAAGIGYLPEDRKEAGLFLEMSIAENIAAARLEQFGAWWLNRAQSETVAQDFIGKLRIAAAHIQQPVVTLSGGNQQKVLLARWLLVNPKVLIVDEPTRGVDVGAKAEVHTLLRQLAEQGTAVIVISSDLPEVLALADRIVVLRAGRVSGELARAAASEEAILRLASL
jgi:ABC-type sugar transport system ATPase subunit